MIRGSRVFSAILIGRISWWSRVSEREEEREGRGRTKKLLLALLCRMAIDLASLARQRGAWKEVGGSEGRGLKQETCCYG